MQFFNIVLGMVAAGIFTVMAFITVPLFDVPADELARMELLDHGRELLTLNQFQWRLVFILAATALGFLGFLAGKSTYKLVIAGVLLATSIFVYFELDARPQMLMDVYYMQVAQLLLIAGFVLGAVLLLAKVAIQEMALRQIQRKPTAEA